MDDEQHLWAARRAALAHFIEARGLPEQFSQVFCSGIQALLPPSLSAQCLQTPRY